VSGQWEYARILTRIESRVTSVERRLRDAIGSAIKFFIDLEDVKARTEEHGTPLTTGDTWGINTDGEWDIITPPGLTGGYASIRLSGYWDGIAGSVTPDGEWAAFTTGLDLNPALASGGLYAVAITEPGVYQVHGSVEADSGEIEVQIFSTDSSGGWQIEGDDPARCITNVVHDQGLLYASASGLFAMQPGGIIEITTDAAGILSLSVAWVHPLAVVDGTCGD